MSPTPPLPSWLSPLHVQTQDSWDWLTHDQAEAHAAALAASLHKRAPSRGLLDEDTLALASGMMTRLKPLAKIPLGAHRLQGATPWAMLWGQRQEAERVLLTTHPFALPLLAIPTAPTLDQIQANLAPYRATDLSPVHTRQVRGFLGTEGILGVGAKDLIAIFSTNPAAEALFWGSLHLEDPWPESIGSAELGALSDQTQGFMAQHPDRVWSMSFRSALSRSVLRLEDHDGVIILQVDYPPATAASWPVVEAMASRSGTRWPPDLPLDVVALVMGLFFETAQAIRALLETHPDRPQEELTLDLYALAALKAYDLTLAQDLKPWVLQSEHEDLQVSAADIALRHNLHGFLLWILATPNLPPSLRRDLEDRLA